LWFLREVVIFLIFRFIVMTTGRGVVFFVSCKQLKRSMRIRMPSRIEMGRCPMCKKSLKVGPSLFQHDYFYEQDDGGGIQQQQPPQQEPFSAADALLSLSVPKN